MHKAGELAGRTFKSNLISSETYHQSVGLSRSAFCDFIKSPIAYKVKYIDKIRQNQTDNEAFKIGRLLHEIVLEPELFKSRYYTDTHLVGVSRLKKEYKDGIKLLEEKNKGKELIKHEISTHVLKMKDILSRNELCEAILNPKDRSGIATELTGYYLSYNILHKVRFDYIDINRKIIVDLKTTNDVASFSKSSLNYFYDMQQYWYTQAAEKLFGCKFDFLFIVIDKAIEHEDQILVTNFNQNDIEDYCGKGYRKYIYDFMNCINTNNFGDALIIHEMQIPEWRKKLYNNLGV